jgi:hypothetical protein
MTDKVLNGPTVLQLVSALAEFHPNTPLRIEDADTGWPIHKIHIEEGDGVVWLSGEYHEMSGKGQFNKAPE